MSAARLEADELGAVEDGPRLVRGIDFTVDAEGVVTVARRPVVALCRCEASARLPWCDGTHAALARRRRPTPTASG